MKFLPRFMHKHQIIFIYLQNKTFNCFLITFAVSKIGKNYRNEFYPKTFPQKIYKRKSAS